MGSTGMLGGMILDYFSRNSDAEIIGTVRDEAQKVSMQEKYPKIKFIKFEAGIDDINSKLGKLSFNWVINAIGVIKPYIKDDNPNEVKRAIEVNGSFPHNLAQLVEEKDAHIIQIATDCVYSGVLGAYHEQSLHDALDVYGKTKSLGEVNRKHFSHLRCSIIGPEFGRSSSLLEWFLGHKANASVGGYINHQWNGVTTLHYAKICLGLISNNIKLASVQHIVPANSLSKYELLKSFSSNFNRSDITINKVDAKVVVDRTLTTNNSELNNAIWRHAGYLEKPTIDQMVREMAEYCQNLNIS